MTTIYISYCDNNDDRKFASTKAEAVEKLIKFNGDEYEVYSGYDEVTTVLTVFPSGEFKSESINLYDDAQIAAEAMTAAYEEEVRDEAGHRAMLMEMRV